MSDTRFTHDGPAVLAAWLRERGAARPLIVCGPSRRGVDGYAAAVPSARLFDGARVHVPAEVVEEAGKLETDAVIAIGGGSAIGLGKALRLARPELPFSAVPTTYAGSEMTTMYGVTRGTDKQTGRDAKVRPDLVIYDVALARDMPIKLTAQSLLNAFAHVASTGEGFAAAGDVLHALEDLLQAPRSIHAREAAARAASACAQAFERGKPGAQHALAHLIGGATRLDHAAIHSILLPQFLAANPSPELEAACDRKDLDGYVHDLLRRAGAPWSFVALGAAPEAIEAALATRPELPAGIARDAIYGLRPSGRGGRIELAGAEALVLGPSPADAHRIVLVLHGRRSEAGTVAREFWEIVGQDRHTCVLGLRAPNHADHWDDVETSIRRVDAALDPLPHTKPITLAGFSQGAAIALEVAARRHGRDLAAVIGIAAPRMSKDPTPGSVEGLIVVLGAQHDDPVIKREWVEATAGWFTASGAKVIDTSEPGDKHDYTHRQRYLARMMILDRIDPLGPTGFGNSFEQQALENALPPRQNSPRLPRYGLYAEQLNGTGFTASRADNRRTWMYRVRPSSQRRPLTPLAHPYVTGTFDAPPVPDLCGFAPLAMSAGDFVDGLVTLMGAGDARLRRGFAFHRYSASRSMTNRAFYNGDGDTMLLPERGALELFTELGPLYVPPGKIAIIPRGMVWTVQLTEASRGYVAESFGRGFRLPERGPVGANGLADPRHFRAPAPWFEDRIEAGYRIVAKLGGHLHEATQDHSPFDVVAWHGNHVPFVYDLADFSPVGNTAFDHGDPSIFTVISAPLDEQGTHALDLVVFPARWDVAAHTFRPAFFHRNAVAEINGIIREKSHGAFQPGVVFVTPPTAPHGVAGRVVERIRHQDDKAADEPHFHAGSLWFQLETALSPSLTAWAQPVDDWAATWGSHRSHFET